MQTLAETDGFQHGDGAYLRFAPAGATVSKDLRDLVNRIQRREEIEALEDEAAMIQPEFVDPAIALRPQALAHSHYLAFIRPH